jgi:hypothetical protein
VCMSDFGGQELGTYLEDSRRAWSRVVGLGAD